MRHTIALTAGLLLVLPASLPAQMLYVQGGPGVEIRRFSAELGEAVHDAEVASLRLSAGGFLTPRWTAGLEFDISRVSWEARSISVTLAGRPETITTDYRLRRRTVAALAGFHTSGGRRVRLSCYAGVAFNALRREVSSDAPAIVLDGPAAPSIFLDRTVSAIIGADLAIHVVPRLALVAGVRAQGLDLAGDASGFSIRPGGGVRILF